VVGEVRGTVAELMEVAARVDPRRAVDAETLMAARHTAQNLRGSFAAAVVGLRAKHARGGDVTGGPRATTL
jgi:hypothetical protein